MSRDSSKILRGSNRGVPPRPATGRLEPIVGVLRVTSGTVSRLSPTLDVYKQKAKVENRGKVKETDTGVRSPRVHTSSHPTKTDG